MVHVIVLSLVYMFIVLYEEEKTERKQWTACVIDNLQFYVLNCEFKLINQRQECIMTILLYNKDDLVITLVPGDCENML